MSTSERAGAPRGASGATGADRGTTVTAAPGARGAEAPRSRQAHLALSRVDPWSVMKLAFLLSIAVGIILLTAVAVLWSVLDTMGIFDTATRFVLEITASDGREGVDVMEYANRERVLTVAAMVAGVNVLLLTALATLGAFLYNLATALVGGLGITLHEER